LRRHAACLLSVVIMALNGVASARKLVLYTGFAFLMWLVAGRFYSFAEQVNRQTREHKQTLEMLERNRQRELAVIQQHHERFYGQPLPTAIPAQAARTNVSKPAHPRMPASALVKRLRQVNAFGLVARRERLLHCTDNHGDWDYTCVFHGDPINSTNWVEFGVLVDNAHIIEMSEAYPSGFPLPPPLSLATR
jgi:hypothetical protein